MTPGSKCGGVDIQDGEIGGVQGGLGHSGRGSGSKWGLRMRGKSVGSWGSRKEIKGLESRGSEQLVRIQWGWNLTLEFHSDGGSDPNGSGIPQEPLSQSLAFGRSGVLRVVCQRPGIMWGCELLGSQFSWVWGLSVWFSNSLSAGGPRGPGVPGSILRACDAAQPRGCGGPAGRSTLTCRRRR